jgi:hypothetical protein
MIIDYMICPDMLKVSYLSSDSFGQVFESDQKRPRICVRGGKF